MNPYLYEKYLEEKRNDMLADTARRQLLRQAQEQKTSRRTQIMLYLATYLISFGENIKRRYETEISAQTSSGKIPCSHKS